MGKKTTKHNKKKPQWIFSFWYTYLRFLVVAYVIYFMANICGCLAFMDRCSSGGSVGATCPSSSQASHTSVLQPLCFADLDSWCQLGGNIQWLLSSACTWAVEIKQCTLWQRLCVQVFLFETPKHDSFPIVTFSALSFWNGLFNPWVWTCTLCKQEFQSKLKNRMANSIDPDETVHNEPSHQDLHYWSRYLFRTGGFKWLSIKIFAFAIGPHGIELNEARVMNEETQAD